MSDMDQIPEKNVIVVGASGLDIVGRLHAPLQAETSNPADIQVSYGGVGRNVAENLARLGQCVSLISVVGNDGTGRHLVDHLIQAGVDPRGVVFSENHSTGVYLAILAKDGTRQQAVVDRSIMEFLQPVHLQPVQSWFKQAAMVFVDANLSVDLIRAVIKLAHKNHVPVCADPSSISLADKLRPFLRQIDILTLNAAEAACLLNVEENKRDAELNLSHGHQLVEKGVKNVIISMGEYGVCYVTPESTGHIPAISTPVVDPTGAGDAFTAAVIYGFLNDLSIDDGIRLAVSAASLSLRSSGSVIPDLNLEMLYQNLVI
jgi:pseudouridine kinase